MSTNIVAGSNPTNFEAASSHTITVRETLAGASNSPRDTVLTINVTDVDDTDTTPNAFTFTPQTGVALSTPITSAPIVVAGITAPSTLTITGGQYSINSGTFASTPTTVVNGDTVAVKVTSSGTNSTAVSATLTIGGVSGTFTVTTLAAGSWVPTDLGSSLVAAYTTLRSGAVHTSGGNITGWDDISTNARNLLSAVGNEPAYGATVFAGGPGLTFDAANNERMISSTSALNFGTGTAFAIFMSIVLRSTTESFGRILGFALEITGSDDIGSGSFNIARQSSNDVFEFYSDSSLCSFPATYDTPLRIAFVYSGTTVRFYVNTVAQTSTAFTATLGPAFTMRVGSYTNGANNFDGDLRALGIMNRDPTSGELTQWDTWLQNPV